MKPGNNTDLSRAVIAPNWCENPTPLANIADWFELHGAALP